MAQIKLACNICVVKIYKGPNLSVPPSVVYMNNVVEVGILYINNKNTQRHLVQMLLEFY